MSRRARHSNVAGASHDLDFECVPELWFDGQRCHVADAAMGANPTADHARLSSSDGFSYRMQDEYGDGLVRSADGLGYVGYGG